jgi:pyruvate,orthophosphate dikinase
MIRGLLAATATAAVTTPAVATARVAAEPSRVTVFARVGARPAVPMPAVAGHGVKVAAARRRASRRAVVPTVAPAFAKEREHVHLLEIAGVVGSMLPAVTKLVYDLAEGSAEMRSLLGGKGANVAEMLRIGVPVPDGFTVTTEACVAAMRGDGVWPDGLWEEILDRLAALEERTGRVLGGGERPLLVSVRSGAVYSMPGMMDSILNLGMSDATVAALARESGDERFAWDSYRRFLQMFGEVVEGVPSDVFERALTRKKTERGVRLDTELTVADLRGLVAEFRRLAREETGRELPDDGREQLRRAVDAVFRSWQNPRARVYRRANAIPDDLGTAVNVMQMVYGNLGEDSATGVCFTRNPSTGARELYGEFLQNAQGEDVVSGVRTPHPLAELEALQPAAFGELVATMARLERHYRDLQDIEFTIEQGRLYLLQTRTGKRTAQAAVRVARELAEEGVLTRDEALGRIDPRQLDQLLHPAIDPALKGSPLARGLNASPGAAVGAVVMDADTAERRGKTGEAVVLVRWETTPDDIHGVIAAQGVLTAHGGMTSHAAVVARGMGKPCVAGVEDLGIDLDARTITVGGVTLAEGAVITLDGSTGEIFGGALALVPPQVNEDFRTIVGWSDAVRRLGVRANADTPDDATRARAFGAEGIGLCRTEHMFMAEDRLPVVREMILAADTAERERALARLEPMQRADFVGILAAMDGLPVTIRLLDPPLHEFLPDLVEQSILVDRLRRDGPSRPLEAAERLLGRIRRLHEANPMLGTRGCRLGLLYPEIYAMQVRAIAQATVELKAAGGDPQPEIMIPLVGFAEELVRMRALVEETCAGLIDVPIGTMIELPRAAVCAGEIAGNADFFSFGTNDLTQTTLGVSRDDAEGAFLAAYVQDGVLRDNPFATIDVDGVGALVRMGCERGRAVKAGLKCGVCGEHGGDPASIAFFHGAGIDYVSCSPYRVPIARLAAAQAALGGGFRDR